MNAIANQISDLEDGQFAGTHLCRLTLTGDRLTLLDAGIMRGVGVPFDRYHHGLCGMFSAKGENTVGAISLNVSANPII